MSVRYKITILCEGVPLHTELTATQAASLDAEVEKRGDASEKVAAVANAYDYDCEWKSNTLCLWRKRYTDDDDLPDVSAGEIIHSLQNLEKLWKSFDTNGSNTYVAEMVQALTPDWEERLSKESVPVSQLPRNMIKPIRLLAWRHITDRSLTPVRLTSFRLSQCEKGHVTLLEKDVLDVGVPIPVYEGELHRGAGKLWTMAVPISYLADSGSGTGFGTLVHNSPTEVRKKAIADALKADPIMRYRYVNETPAFATTLQGLVNILNSRRTTGASAILCDEMVARKKVCIWGAEYTSSSAILESLASLYDLRIGARNNRGVLTGNGIRFRNDVTFLGEESIRLIPLPIRRYIWGDTVGEPFRLEADRRQSLRSIALYRNAMGRLRVLADGAIAAAPDGKVPIKAMPHPTLDLIALSSIAQICHPFLTSLQQPIPSYLVNLDLATVGITITVRNPAPYGSSLNYKFTDGKTGLEGYANF